MYDTSTPTTVDILDLFHTESATLSDSTKKYFKYHILEEDGELWAAGTKFYDPIDLLTERGILATARMLLVKEETISFNRVSQILLSDFYTTKNDKKGIISLQSKFKKLRIESNEVFDMFWHVTHLHKDISDERFIKHFNLMHSCAGPGTYTRLYDHIVEFSELFDNLDDEFVIPVLTSKGRLPA